ncbi:MAG: beta-ketoacyl synthase chain length factor [Alphaproteobacteria bacterium]|nr:beta-ketoacyl synthase chain length factor [Alphaproteobacteria bacterium]
MGTEGVHEQPRFEVADWFAWEPSLESRAAWRDWAGAPVAANDSEPLPALPMMLRRRLTVFGQKLIGGALSCKDVVGDARYIFGTRHGELGRAMRIFNDIEDGQTPSPTDFSLSIHHALIGLLSIDARNRTGHTALSAGRDSFGYSLVESAACLAERPDEPVLLIYGDEKLPAGYDTFREADDALLPLVVVLALRRPHDDAGALSLHMRARGQDEVQSPSGAHDFLRFLLSGASSAVSVGDRMRWEWRRAA